MKRARRFLLLLVLISCFVRLQALDLHNNTNGSEIRVAVEEEEGAAAMDMSVVRKLGGSGGGRGGGRAGGGRGSRGGGRGYRTPTIVGAGVGAAAVHHRNGKNSAAAAVSVPFPPAAVTVGVALLIWWPY